MLFPLYAGGRRVLRWATAAVSAVPRTVLAGGAGAGLRRVASRRPADFTTVSLAGLLMRREGDLALLTFRDGRGNLVVAVVASPEVLRVGTGSLDVVEAPPGVLRVGMGCFEAYPPGVFCGRGMGGWGKALPVAVAPPPGIFRMGTGSLDFQAASAPVRVPRTLWVGGGATTPLAPTEAVPVNLLAARVGKEHLLVLIAVAAILCLWSFENRFRAV